MKTTFKSMAEFAVYAEKYGYLQICNDLIEEGLKDQRISEILRKAGAHVDIPTRLETEIDGDELTKFIKWAKKVTVNKQKIFLEIEVEKE